MPFQSSSNPDELWLPKMPIHKKKSEDGVLDTGQLFDLGPANCVCFPLQKGLSEMYFKNCLNFSGDDPVQD